MAQGHYREKRERVGKGYREQGGVVNAYFLSPAHSPTPLIDPVERLISCFIAARAMEFLNNFAQFVYSSARVWETTKGAAQGPGEGVGLQACPACTKKKRGSRRLAKQNEHRVGATREWGVTSNVNCIEVGVG